MAHSATNSPKVTISPGGAESGGGHRSALIASGGDGQKRVHDGHVELASGTPPELVACLLVSSRGAVRTVTSHGRIGVDHRHDSSFQRDLVADQAARIAVAVGTLVVTADPLADVVEADIAEEGRAQIGLAADPCPLLIVERPPLLEDLGGNLIPPDVA